MGPRVGPTRFERRRPPGLAASSAPDSRKTKFKSAPGALKIWWPLRRPRSLRTTCLLSKPSRRLVDVKVEYVGFEIPDKFVVGYGLDYAERYRNLPYIGVLGLD